jgi:two-component system sensor histidine kinase MprB
MPKSLAGRLALILTVTALAVLLAVGGALFVVLRGLHRDAAFGRLHAVGATIVGQLGARADRADVATALGTLGGQLDALDITLLFEAGQGRPLILLAGTAQPVNPVPAIPSGGRGTVADATVPFDDGTTRAVSVVPLTAPGALLPRAIVLATPDRAGAETLGDLVRTLPLVGLVLLLIGAPLAWLLARSTTGPLRRLAVATTAVSSARTGAEPAPLPAEGPSEVRELTERFNAMRGELAQTRRAETELLANLRHDLRTPLTVIGGFAEALVDGTASGDAAPRAARAIADETARLERLVGALGSLDGLGDEPAGLRPEQLDAATLLAEAGARFESRATAAGVDLVTEPPREPLAFAADRLAIERILSNLVENALTAIGQPAPGGSAPRVLLAARSARTPDGRPAVMLSVSDEGPGFPPGGLEHAFDRSYRGDPSRSGPGSGLGLAIVRELARRHGGDAIAENLAPRGARVSVALPIVPATLAG